MEDEPGMYHERYRTCIKRSWEPSQEQHDHVPIDSIITGWKNNVGVTTTPMVFGVKTEKELKIPNGEKFHLYNHLEMIKYSPLVLCIGPSSGILFKFLSVNLPFLMFKVDQLGCEGTIDDKILDTKALSFLLLN